MIQNNPALRFPRLFVATAMLLASSACVTTPKQEAWVLGRQVTIEGDIVSVDTHPWAYDGNAVVTVSTANAGAIKVQLPARWNLCKAPPPDNLQALKPHDRVRIVGTTTAPGEMVVCAEPEHQLRKVD